MAFQNEWLEMRVNIGLIIPAVMFLVTAVVLLMKKPLNLSGRFTAVNLFVGVWAAFLILGSKRLLVVPAAMIREAIKMTDLGFSTINLVLIIGLIAGLTAIWVGKPTNQ
jgi:hypothetical protein